MTTQILDDPRPIKRLIFYGDESIDVGNLAAADDARRVTRIEAYGEKGMYNDIPFFAVYSGDEIVRRVPAAHVEVEYK